MYLVDARIQVPAYISVPFHLVLGSLFPNPFITILIISLRNPFFDEIFKVFGEVEVSISTPCGIFLAKFDLSIGDQVGMQLTTI
jgi:hypothetical protein